MYQKIRSPLTFIFFIALGLCSKMSYAQFILSGEVRPRFEFRNGFKSINTSSNSAAAFIEQRTRLNFSFQNPKLGFFVSFQDVRIWGNAAQIYKSDPALTNVYEAWGAYHFNHHSLIRAGRQSLSYDNERFLGGLDWAQQGRSHDALRYIYTDSTGFSFHAGVAFNQNVPSEPTELSSTYYGGVANYKTMQYLWLHKDWKKGGLSFLAFNDGRQKTDSTTAFRQTFGFYAEQALGSSKLHGELYYQTGKNPAGLNINAFLVSFSVAFPKVWASPEMGADYLSGTKTTDTKDKAFDPAYGTNHKFYGYMDYFYVGNGHAQAGKTAGLIDIYLQTKFSLNKTSALLINLHQFNAPVDINDGGQNLSSSLGQEADLVYNIDVAPSVNFKLGYAQFRSTRTTEVLKGGAEKSGTNQWAWAMFTIKPTLFSAK